MSWFRRARRGDTATAEVDSLLRQSLLVALGPDQRRAEALLARVVKLAPDDIDAYLALARIYRERGDVARAIGLHQALVLRRDLARERRVSVLCELAADLRQGGLLRRAVAAYEEVLEHDQRHVEALAALAVLLDELGEHERALLMLRRRARVQGKPDRRGEAALLLHLAGRERGLDRRSSARKAIRRALRRDSRNAEAHIALGELEAACGRHKRALAAWRSALALAGERAAQLYPKLAESFAALHRGGDYEAFLRSRLDREPRDGAARLALAGHLADLGDAEAAVAELRRALEHEPGDLAVHLALGRLLVSLDRQPDTAKGYAELLAVLGERNDLLMRETLQ